MATFGQRFRSKAPAPVNTRNHGAQHGVAVIDRDRSARFRCAAQGRRGVVGQISALQRTSVLSYVIGYLWSAGSGRSGIYRQLKRR